MKTDNMLFNIDRFNPRTDKVLIRDLKTLKFFVLKNKHWKCVPKKNISNTSCMDYHFPKLEEIKKNKENTISYMISEIRDYPGAWEALEKLGIPDASLLGDPKCVLLGLKLMMQKYLEFQSMLKNYENGEYYHSVNGTYEQPEVVEFFKELKEYYDEDKR
jgi:hypothetical protein